MKATLAAALILTFSNGLTLADDHWRQWGGADRNFSVETDRTLDQLKIRENWRRPLGEGYSAILVDEGRLYTMFRRDDSEYVTCLDAASGKTIWEMHYSAPLPEEASAEFGKGPNSTPLIVDNRLVTIGFNGDLHCLEKTSGEVIWKANLIRDHQGTFVDLGYSASPIHYKGNVILPIGGEGQAVVAFQLADGAIAWSALDFKNSYSTPLLTSVNGMDQLVLAMTDEVVGIDPNNGELFWNFPMTNQFSLHAFVPVWDGRSNILFVSSFQQSHALQLAREGTKIEAQKLWSVDNSGVGFTNAVLIGDVVYGTTGSSRAPLVSAINLKDGTFQWRERGFAVSNYLAVGDHILLLDETGVLGIAKPTPDSLGVVGRQQVLGEQKVWTVPTMIGNTLFARDQKEIISLYLD